MPLSALLAAAAARGLCCSVPPGGFVEDLFANRTEEFSDSWQLCLLRFVRAGAADCAAAAAALTLASQAEY